MSLLPSSPDVAPDSEPRLVGLESDEADDLMAALSSETARRLLAELHDEPAPPGELADRVDTSLQNAQYHLEKLESAGAVEAVGTAYSEKGREMTVFGPSDSPLVIYAGEQERASGLRAALTRLFTGVLALGVGSLAIQELFGRSVFRRASEDAAPGAGGAGGTPTATPDGGNGADRGAGDGGGNGADIARDDGATATGEPTGTEVYDARTANRTAEATPEPVGTPAATKTEAPQAGGGAAGTETPAPTDTPAPSPTAVEDAGGGPLDLVDGLLEGLLAGGLPPGLAFFIGGLAVLLFVVATTYVRAQP